MLLWIMVLLGTIWFLTGAVGYWIVSAPLAELPTFEDLRAMEAAARKENAA